MKKFLMIACPILLVAVIAIQGIFLASAYHKINTLQKAIPPGLQGQLDQLQANASVGIDAASFSPAVISIKDSKVYLPDVGLQLPLDFKVTGLLYDMRQTGGPDTTTTVYDVTTRELVSTPQPLKATSCTSPVRLGFGIKADPFNPNEKTNTPVKLADGRTLQIYTNTDPSCAQHWKSTSTIPADIAQMFQKATSY
jgi:hypothetical protein